MRIDLKSTMILLFVFTFSTGQAFASIFDYTAKSDNKHYYSLREEMIKKVDLLDGVILIPADRLYSNPWSEIELELKEFLAKKGFLKSSFDKEETFSVIDSLNNQFMKTTNVVLDNGTDVCLIFPTLKNITSEDFLQRATGVKLEDTFVSDGDIHTYEYYRAMFKCNNRDLADIESHIFASFALTRDQGTTEVGRYMASMLDFIMFQNAIHQEEGISDAPGIILKESLDLVETELASIKEANEIRLEKLTHFTYNSSRDITEEIAVFQNIADIVKVNKIKDMILVYEILNKISKNKVQVVDDLYYSIKTILKIEDDLELGVE